jgi:hypothetical protein
MHGMRTLFIASFLFFSSAMFGVSAETLLELRQLKEGADLKFFHEFMVNDSTVGEFVRSGEMNDSNFYFAYFDLNGDGRNELIVQVEHGTTCGTAGCSYFVFEMIGSNWKQIGENLGGGIIVTDESVKGYRTLVSEKFGLRWDGTEYKDFCVVKQDWCGD